MVGSKTNSMSLKEVMEAVKAIPASQDFVWNGIDEDDRPATEEELAWGMNGQCTDQRPQRYRHPTQIALRIGSNSVLEAFRVTGKGWQTA